MNRNLDGCYFRVKRDGKYGNVCFSDLTEKEREELFDGKQKPSEWWQTLAYHLADCLKNIGDQFEIMKEER